MPKKLTPSKQAEQDFKNQNINNVLKSKCIKEYKFLGVDASLTGTGLVMINYDGKILKHTRIESKDLGVERLADINIKILEFTKYSSNILMIKEGYAYGKTQKAHNMGELGGVLMHEWWNRNIPFIVIAPQTVKKFACGHAKKKDKGSMRLAVYKRWKVELPSEDECDALACAHFGRRLIKGLLKKISVLNYELECFSSFLGRKLKNEIKIKEKNKTKK